MSISTADPVQAPRASGLETLPQPELSSSRLLLPTDTTLHYVEKHPPVRRADPPVVLIHGFSDSWRSFEEMLGRWPLDAHDAPVYALDLRGHGRSSEPEAGGYAMDDFAADVTAFLDALGIERAVVVGHSMGGLVAQALAVAYPDRVDRLVLISTAASMVGHPVLAEMGPAIEAFADDESAPLEFVLDFQASTFHTPPAPHVLYRYAAESLRLRGAVWKGAIAGMGGADYRSRLAAVAAPALMLWGEEDGVFSRAEQEELCALLPDATLRTYPGAGHALNVERADEVADAICAFASSTR
jgi:pimeloyl-ACP methyl ester carboxylesterase